MKTSINRLSKSISLIILSFCLASLPLALTACKSTPQQVAYQSAGTVATAVPVAMAAWDVWVKAGKSTTNQELQVKAAYEKYQTAMEVACDAGAIYAATSVTNATASQQFQLAEAQAIANASQSIADLESLIRSFGVSF